MLTPHKEPGAPVLTPPPRSHLALTWGSTAREQCLACFKAAHAKDFGLFPAHTRNQILETRVVVWTWESMLSVCGTGADLRFHPPYTILSKPCLTPSPKLPSSFTNQFRWMKDVESTINSKQGIPGKQVGWYNSHGDPRPDYKLRHPKPLSLYFPCLSNAENYVQFPKRLRSNLK